MIDRVSNSTIMCSDTPFWQPAGLQTVGNSARKQIRIREQCNIRTNCQYPCYGKKCFSFMRMVLLYNMIEIWPQLLVISSRFRWNGPRSVPSKRIFSKSSVKCFASQSRHKRSDTIMQRCIKTVHVLVANWTHDPETELFTDWEI